MKLILGLSIIFGLLFIASCSDNENVNFEQYQHTDDELHDHSVEIEGKEMKTMTIQKIADLWEIDSERLLDKIKEEFELKSDYSAKTILDEMREEYKFSPALIKDIAEEIKEEDTIK